MHFDIFLRIKNDTHSACIAWKINASIPSETERYQLIMRLYRKDIWKFLWATFGVCIVYEWARWAVSCRSNNHQTMSFWHLNREIYLLNGCRRHMRYTKLIRFTKKHFVYTAMHRWMSSDLCSLPFRTSTFRLQLEIWLIVLFFYGANHCLLWFK